MKNILIKIGNWTGLSDWDQFVYTVKLLLIIFADIGIVFIVKNPFVQFTFILMLVALIFHAIDEKNQEIKRYKEKLEFHNLDPDPHVRD